MSLRLIALFVLLNFATTNDGFSQVLENSGLENWVQDTFNTTLFGLQIQSQFERPLHWMTPDKYAESSLLNTSLVAKDTNSYTGTYAAKLSTKSITIPGQGTFARPGALTNGQLTLNLSNFLYSFSGVRLLTAAPLD